MPLKLPNWQLPVAVDHNQLRTMALETVDSIDWQFPLPFKGQCPHLHGENERYKSRVQSAGFDPVAFRIPGHRIAYMRPLRVSQTSQMMLLFVIIIHLNRISNIHHVSQNLDSIVNIIYKLIYITKGTRNFS